MTKNAHQGPETAEQVDLDQFAPPEFLLAKLNSGIRDLMNTALRPHGLKLVEWRLLQCLIHADEPRTVAELAELTVIDRTVASRLIDKMAARGLVTKQAMAQDRRFVSVTVSDAGRAAYKQSSEAARDARQRLFGGLGAEDIEHLLDMLAVMNANAEHPLRQVLPYQRSKRVSGG
ncbi:MAG: MarR family winged helix-turn-helix transcriptional regulator [Paracoccaceae bacterium]